MAGAVPEEAALPLAGEVQKETTHDDLEGLVQRVFDKLGPRFEDVVRQALEKATADTDKKIAAVKGELRGEFTAQLSAHGETEAKKRQEAIDGVNRRISEVSEETTRKLGEFNTLVGEATKTVSEAMQTVRLLSIEIKGWNNVLGSSRELYAENKRDIERLENESGNVIKEQAALTEKITAMHRTIHGGDGEDTPSIFSELKRAWEYNLKQSHQIQAALEVAKDNAQRMDRMEQERQQEKEAAAKAEQEKKERSKKRMKAMVSVAKETAKNPLALVFIVSLAILAIVAIFSPTSLPQLITFAQNFLSAKP